MSSSATTVRFSASTQPVHSMPRPSAIMFADWRMALVKCASNISAYSASAPTSLPMPSDWICTPDGYVDTSLRWRARICRMRPV